mgnify:CR=1 FL=1
MNNFIANCIYTRIVRTRNCVNSNISKNIIEDIVDVVDEIYDNVDWADDLFLDLSETVELN